MGSRRDARVRAVPPRSRRTAKGAPIQLMTMARCPRDFLAREGGEGKGAENARAEKRREARFPRGERNKQ